MPTKMNKQKYRQIALYFLIALCFSYLFRINPPSIIENYEPLNEMSLFKLLLEGIGPIVAAIIVMSLFKIKSPISTFGTSVPRSCIMLVIPIILFTAIGMENKLNLEPHYYGFVLSILTLIYAYFEEYGWRKYLNHELKDLNAIVRSLIIGSLWFCWHLNFTIKLEDQVLFWSILVFSSWGLDKIVTQTKSLIAVSCFHVIGSIVSFNKLINFTSSQRYLILSIVLITWIFIVSKWGKNLKTDKT